MTSIGIRELRQNASRYLRLVEEGEVIEVTDRGRPIARIVPIPEDEDPIERLERLGLISGPADSSRLLAIEPRPPKPGVPLPSVLLQEERDSYYEIQ